jgi:hypothetical protein
MGRQLRLSRQRQRRLRLLLLLLVAGAVSARYITVSHAIRSFIRAGWYLVARSAQSALPVKPWLRWQTRTLLEGPT